MNILFFAENSPYLAIRVGGAENSMRLMAEGLAAKGHHVTFASLRPDVLPAARRFRAGGVEVVLLPAIRRSLLGRGVVWGYRRLWPLLQKWRGASNEPSPPPKLGAADYSPAPPQPCEAAS